MSDNKIIPLTWCACSYDSCITTCEDRKKWKTEIIIEVCNQEDPENQVIKKVLHMMNPLIFKEFTKWLKEKRDGRAVA